MLAITPPLCAQNLDKPKAYKVKAAYLYNFAKFIHWPDHVLQDDDEPFVIGVLDNDEFAVIVRTTVHNKKIAGHHVVVQHFNWNDREDRISMKQCQMLYISESRSNRLHKILEHLNHNSLLLVGDSSDFARKGGMIGFVLEQGRIVFDINQEAIEQATLEISSKLLKLARVVWGD